MAHFVPLTSETCRCGKWCQTPCCSPERRTIENSVVVVIVVVVVGKVVVVVLLVVVVIIVVVIVVMLGFVIVYNLDIPLWWEVVQDCPWLHKKLI